MSSMKPPIAPAKTTRTTKQQKALQAFCHHLASARELNTLIGRHLDDHLGLGPDEVNWAHVGDASRLHNALREIATTCNLI
jgi:hypothetical protein